MLSLHSVDTCNRADVRRFVRVPFKLYQGNLNWVPPILMDAYTQLNRYKHPFYEHSTADFWIATRDGEDVGRIAALENVNFNRHHGTRQAQFYLFDCVDDQEAADGLFERAFEWARARGLTEIVGPKGFGPLDGYGLLIEGFEHRQMMTMMNYNHAYYPRLVEALGFVKEVDFVSCYLAADSFRLPERVHRIAERAARASGLSVMWFRSKRELKSWAGRIGRTYNLAFVDNWEYVPLTDREIKFVTDNVLTVADPKLIKIILHGDDVVGFLFAFPDVSAALQRTGGRLFPLGIVDLLLEFRRTKWVALNGAGILPEFQGRGGNALLYSEMEKTVREYGFEHADLTQVAESAVQMRQDLVNVGGVPYKNHRVYRRGL